ncbi:UNVERIFIED_CONTAM: hypothetical protein Sradi_6231400 [Sesamum radiatum]|uniref:Uncharacterized protein n=1 Tax=Sesamum radiatum TaxID=300843 RepID=A0AAW2KB46_SESRA
MESAESSIALASTTGGEISWEGIAFDASIPPTGSPAIGLPPEHAQILQVAFQAKTQS